MDVLETREDPYLSVKEAADLLGVTQRRVLQFRAEGRLRGAKRFGKSWAIAKSEVERFADEPRNPGRPKSVA